MQAYQKHQHKAVIDNKTQVTRCVCYIVTTNQRNNEPERESAPEPSNKLSIPSNQLETDKTKMRTNYCTSRWPRMLPTMTKDKLDLFPLNPPYARILEACC
jgi:hypothetical protein